MKTLIVYLATYLGVLLVIFGMFLHWVFTQNQDKLVPAYTIQKEYATLKITSKLTDVEKTTLKKRPYPGAEAYLAKVYLSPHDWFDEEIPYTLYMVFSGIENDWGVQVNNQKPVIQADKDHTLLPAHYYDRNGPTNKFWLKMPDPSATYEFTVLFYPKSKDADPNFYCNNVRVHFIWMLKKNNDGNLIQ